MTDALAIHRAMFEAAQKRDFDAMRRLLHPDYTYTAADGVEQKGVDAGIAVAQMYLGAFPDVTMEIRPTASAGNVSVVEVVGRGTHTGALGDLPPTGKSITVHLCNVIEVQDGLVVREREYFDRMVLMEQLGVG